MIEPKLEKNIPIKNKTINVQKKYIILSIFMLVLITISASYAYLTNYDSTEQVITITSGNMAVTVSNNSIVLENVFPSTDEDGLTTSPISITVTNTGDMDIGSYTVKLKNDATKSTTLNHEFIKYAVSTDNGVTYSSSRKLSENDELYKGSDLLVNASKTIYLKLWVSNEADNTAVNKTFYGAVDVVIDMKPLTIANDMSDKLNDSNSITEDNIKYLSGTNDTINFNYVWYSGRMWRVTAIYPDGSVKMITDDLQTSINRHYEDSSFYNIENNSPSYTYQWLNEDFLDTLYNWENIIVTDPTWNATNSNANSEDDVIVKLPETTLINNSTIGKNTPIGLLNSYEYYMSYKKTTADLGYLNIGYNWSLLNSYDDTKEWIVSYNSIYGQEPCVGQGIRPTIIINNAIKFVLGNGTKNNPYILQNDKEKGKSKELLNTRTVGEYVEFNNDTYRIVSVDDNNQTKIVKDDYIRNSDNSIIKQLGNINWKTPLNFFSSNPGTMDCYLKKNWYNTISTDNIDMIAEEATYFLNSVSDFGSNYKKTICDIEMYNTEELLLNVKVKDCVKTTNIWTTSSSNGYVGLLRYGEMFACGQHEGINNSENELIITKASYQLIISKYGFVNIIDNKEFMAKYTARPTLFLKSSVKIASTNKGDGTKNNPYEISL